MTGRSIVQVYIIFTLCGTGGSVQHENCTDGDIENIGSGYCTVDNNNEGCMYDGGDCCQCTSIDDGSSSSDTSSTYFLCVDPSSPCYSPTAVALQSNCTDGDIADIGNGWCDEENNNEGCLYDGGDCCECTSMDDRYSSFDASSPYIYCVDPGSPCYSPIADDLQSNCTDGDIADIGNGRCDEENNNEGCLYDGGDCCECTSMDDGYSFSDTSSPSFLCVDPSSPCYSPTAVALQSNCTDGDLVDIGNGWCDEENNNEGCLYDGGDCCECTSMDDRYSSFDASSPYIYCVDPSSPCYSPIAVDLQSNCTNGNITDIRNGWCDEENNNEGCLYDGGDCCECTSMDDRYSSFDASSPYIYCVDPGSPCYSPIAVDLQSNCTDGDIADIGNGWCDEENNNEGCLYDGGDCCECTSMDDRYSSSDTSSPYFLCVDPSSPCYSPIAVDLQSNCTDGDITDIGNGWCDEENNNEGCLYDGGDCCECTSIDDGYSSSDTSSPYFLCVDPSSPCYSPTAVALQSNCTDGDIVDIGNGWCDEEKNNEGCLYDGGDCCICTCIHGQYYECSSSGFKCLDPDVADLEPYICDKSQHTLTACAGEQREWTVENASHVRALAKAVRCSGGLFYVTWKGKVSVEKTISIFDGTILKITSINSDSVIDGNGNTRLFSVVNASLHLSNITVSNGNAAYGGAIAASRSRASFTMVSFIGNTATNDGGALHLSNGTFVTFVGDTTFLNNTASNGGALCVMDGSNASWTRNTSFSYNVATLNGGALYLMDHSSAVWKAKAHFLHNSAGDDGGALYLYDSSSAVWTAEAHFLNNSAEYRGGALYLTDSSSAVWTAEAHFLNNSAEYRGGALYLTDSSSAVWTAEAHFLHNSAESFGGALDLYGSSADWTAEVHFLHNRADSFGGALRLSDSSAVWTAEAHFLHNSAEDGGALYLYDSSAVWTAEAHFLHNSAGDGGALYLTDSSSAVWTAEAYFLNNSAEYSGGALYLYDSSSADWTAEAHFLHNSAETFGGALNLYRSSADWTAETQFLHNRAETFGGALRLSDSSAVWTAEAHFLHNSAESSGGALYLSDSSGDWTAEAHFHNNSAKNNGGALCLDDSSAIWTAEAHFLHNSGGDGGALYLSSSSSVWTAEVNFLNNSAEDDGGALYVTDGSKSSWEGNTHSSENASTGGRGGALYGSGISSANWTAVCIFYGNNALSNGGAVYADDGASLSWSVKTLFVDNAARNGGALFLSNGVNAQWSEETSFISNYARLDGGAVVHWSANDEGSIIAINGTTRFVNNKCGVNGGAMSLVQSVALVLGTKDITFWKNYAGASGGAIYTAFNGIGIVFMEVAFVENVAQIGGGVHSTGSGTEVTVDIGKAQNNPMTFDRCKFVRNYAFATGGAVDSASGQDVFVRTSFNGNKARLGGALRLAGIASIDNCSFEENVSELGGGPAVSNSGYMSNATNSYFDNNVFNCKAQTFLHFNELDDPFKTVCNGCPSSCFECSFGEGQGSPTCTSLSEAGMEHTTSKGGNTTVEELLIQKGYWRATNTSTNILRCLNTKACQGGLTGALDYCALGYEGPYPPGPICPVSNFPTSVARHVVVPAIQCTSQSVSYSCRRCQQPHCLDPYCSVCSKNYVSTLRFTCRECSDRTAVVATAAVLLSLALVVIIAVVSYLVSTDVVGDRRGIVDHVMERVPLQPVKIIITVWQILTQFTFVANVNFPSVYQKFLDGVNFLNFDISWVLSTGCLVEVDFHDRLLLTTISPLVIMGLLGVTYAISLRRNLDSTETSRRTTQHKHVSIALLVTFLVYSSVSSVVFQMFACENLDDGKRYLRADYTIECDSYKHRVLQMYSGFMIMLYPVGIPALYASLLFRNSEFLGNDHALEESPLIRSISNLWKPYKPHRFYYEVIECARRISLTGVIVFIYPNSAAQVAVTFAIAVVFIFVSEGMAPYESPWDAWMSRMSQAIIFASMYLALLLKVNVSGENYASQNMFEVILVACHGCMVIAMIVQIVIMVLSLRAGRQYEDPRPRLRRPLSSTLAIQPCLVEEDDTSKEEL